MKDYASNVLKRENTIKPGKKILLLDHATSHTDSLSIDKVSQYNFIPLLIPKGYTSSLQPLDCMIIRSFKCNERKLLYKYIINNRDNRKLSREKIIKLIVDAWNKVDI